MGGLPYPDGTVLRCTRPTPWGLDVVYGVVRPWHNDEGWVVIQPEGGIVAAPGEESYLGHDRSPAAWTFTAIDPDAPTVTLIIPEEAVGALAHAIRVVWRHTFKAEADLVRKHGARADVSSKVERRALLEECYRALGKDPSHITRGPQ